LIKGPGTATGLVPLQGLQDFYYCRSGRIWHAQLQADGQSRGRMRQYELSLQPGLYDRPQLRPDGSLALIKDGTIVMHSMQGVTSLLAGSGGCSGLSWPLRSVCGVYACPYQAKQAIWCMDQHGATRVIFADSMADYIDPRLDSNGFLVAGIKKSRNGSSVVVGDMLSGALWELPIAGYQVTGICWAARSSLLDKMTNVSYS
jgi:hypothetical protein